LTITRAVSGLSRDAIAFASSKRPLPFEKGGGVSLLSTLRNRRGAVSPWFAGFPRTMTFKSEGFDSAIV
jgi:hypothetical protein